jgi:hypothetical protein
MQGMIAAVEFFPPPAVNPKKQPLRLEDQDRPTIGIERLTQERQGRCSRQQMRLHRPALA